MSVVTVQVGQCGNQLGFALLSTLFDDLARGGEVRDLETFFYEANTSSSGNNSARSSSAPPMRARAVLVDMEPKVINDCLALTKTWDRDWCYSSRRTFVRQRGSGNNWAHGYCAHGPQVYDNIRELCRKEAEACDYLGGFLLLHSAAGGTGSGVGSLITERLKDDFPSATVMNNVVFPHSTGEVVVQSYNALLTMSHVLGGSASGSNAVLCSFNDRAHDVCTNMMRIKRPSITDLNQVLASDLALALLPSSTSLDPHSSTWGRDVLGSLTSKLCPHPGMKLLDAISVPQMPFESIQYSAHSWESLLKHLYQMHITGSALDLGVDWQANANTQLRNRSIALQLSLRGEGAIQAITSSPAHNNINSSNSINPHTYANTSSTTSRNKPSTTSTNASITPGRIRASPNRSGRRSSGVTGGSGGPGSSSSDKRSARRRQQIAEEDEGLNARDYVNQFGDKALYASWEGGLNGDNVCSHFHDRLGVHATDRTREQGGVVGGFERVASLVSNAQTIVGPLERAVVKAHNMWSAGAYVHQYERHGLERDAFRHALVHLEQVISDYQHL